MPSPPGSVQSSGTAAVAHSKPLRSTSGAGLGAQAAKSSAGTTAGPPELDAPDSAPGPLAAVAKLVETSALLGDVDVDCPPPVEVQATSSRIGRVSSHRGAHLDTDGHISRSGSAAEPCWPPFFGRQREAGDSVFCRLAE